jgi:hypothetical protein
MALGGSDFLILLLGHAGIGWAGSWLVAENRPLGSATVGVESWLDRLHAGTAGWGLPRAGLHGLGDEVAGLDELLRSGCMGSCKH